MKHIVAVNSNCYHGYSIEDAIESISANGFHAIELTATKGWTEHVFPSMSFNALLTIKNKLKDADLTPIAMSGHTNLMDEDRLPDFVANINLAAFYDCQYIVSSIGEAHLEDKAVTSNEKAAENIRQLVPYLRDHGLTLVLENHGEHGTGKIIKEIVNLVDSPRVLINYDTANVIYYADLDPVKDIPSCVDKIGFMHIKDKIGGPKEWNFPALGKGRVDFPWIFELLDKAGNNCPLSIEIEFTESGPKNLTEIDQAVGDSYKYLADLGFDI
jgi:sugar phosphate isomerase/epimerase